jgi:hypothetical protein
MKLNNNIALNLRVNGDDLTHYIRTINVAEVSGRFVYSQDNVLTYINYSNNKIFFRGNGKIAFTQPINLTINENHHITVMRGDEEIILSPGTYTNESLHEVAGNESMDEVHDGLYTDQAQYTGNEQILEDDGYDDDIVPHSNLEGFFSPQMDNYNKYIERNRKNAEENEKRQINMFQDYISKLDKVNFQKTFLDYDDIIALEQLAVNEYKIQQLIKDNKIEISEEQQIKLASLDEFLMLLPLISEEERKSFRENEQEQNAYYMNNTEAPFYEELNEVVNSILGDIPYNIDINDLLKL